MNITSVRRPVFLVNIVVVLLLICVGGCQQKLETPTDPTVAKEICLRLWTDYLETLKTVQPNKIAGWFTKEAVLVYHGMAEFRSRDSIEAFLVNVLPGRKYLELTFTLHHFDVVGSKAYTFVTLDELVEESGQSQARYQTRCGVVWQRQADNTWQISYDLINYLKL
jgi:uncharacterized protein (TIGR02246 family)